MTITAAQRERGSYGNRAVVLDWETEFLPWARGRKTSARLLGEAVPLPRPWRPGVHWALIGPTGQGKSTHAVGILSQRKWVVALDPKGEDETLEASGYHRVTSMPPPRGRPWGTPRPPTQRWIWDQVEKDQPVGLIAGFEAKTDEEDAKLQALLLDAITFVRRSRGWTLYVDEFELLSSMRMMNLGKYIERMLITARRAGTSVVTSYQAPAWVSKHASRQAGLVTTWQTGDRDSVMAIARSMGRDWRNVGMAVDELPSYFSLTIPLDIKMPMLVTTAPKVS
jgi:hypothetical protein